jgi:hypothetical protein
MNEDELARLRLLSAVCEGRVQRRLRYGSTMLYTKGRVDEPVPPPSELEATSVRLRALLSEGLVELPEDPGPYVLTEAGRQALGAATGRAG